MGHSRNCNDATAKVYAPRSMRTRWLLLLSLIVTSFTLSGCVNALLTERQPAVAEHSTELTPTVDPDSPDEAPLAKATDNAVVANVTDVAVSGSAGSYQLSVTIASPDLGCDQYADWWEVLDTDGNLLYRRVLAHSHVDEQPFTRSGGPVAISPDQPIIVRAHMYPSGYGGQALQGSVAAGLAAVDLSAEFADQLAAQAPLPQNCAF